MDTSPKCKHTTTSQYVLLGGNTQPQGLTGRCVFSGHRCVAARGRAAAWRLSSVPSGRGCRVRRGDLPPAHCRELSGVDSHGNTEWSLSASSFDFREPSCFHIPTVSSASPSAPSQMRHGSSPFVSVTGSKLSVAAPKPASLASSQVQSSPDCLGHCCSRWSH